jgi:hypothetical protein
MDAILRQARQFVAQVKDSVEEIRADSRRETQISADWAHQSEADSFGQLCKRLEAVGIFLGRESKEAYLQILAELSQYLLLPEEFMALSEGLEVCEADDLQCNCEEYLMACSSRVHELCKGLHVKADREIIDGYERQLKFNFLAVSVFKALYYLERQRLVGRRVLGIPVSRWWVF